MPSFMKKMALGVGSALFVAQNTFAVAVLDLSTAKSTVDSEIAGAATVIAGIIGISVAVVLVMKLVKRA